MLQILWRISGKSLVTISRICQSKNRFFSKRFCLFYKIFEISNLNFFSWKQKIISRMKWIWKLLETIFKRFISSFVCFKCLIPKNNYQIPHYSLSQHLLTKLCKHIKNIFWKGLLGITTFEIDFFGSRCPKEMIFGLRHL